jgi:HPt (histidine-containing phosphotransfer) domain-containing protein
MWKLIDGEGPSNLGGSGRSEDGALPESSGWSAGILIERLDGDETLARQLVTLFLGEYPKLLSSLRASLGSRDADAVRRAAHAAKGCLANFIDGGPQATAYAIERIAARGELDGVPSLVAQLEREVGVLALQMNEFERRAPCAS